MDNQTLWGVITLVFTLGYGGYLAMRFGDDQNFALNSIDYAYAISFTVLLFCYANGLFPIPSTVLAIAAGAFFFVVRWGIKAVKNSRTHG